MKGASLAGRTAAVRCAGSLAAATLCLVAARGLAAPPPAISGIYPHLALFNDENECGTGAVVPWAGRLWVVTYAPHKPLGSSDKLYEITPDLEQIIRTESVGGTPANRMIHRESQQLLIGPYVINAHGEVRVLSPQRLPGRLTGVARHLTRPATHVYYATMEEGFYEVDVRTLDVLELHPDANSLSDHAGPLLPGYHGKGCYSGQGRVVYANNGELSSLAQQQPNIPSGCLAEWDGREWRVVRRNQFTEVTGPGGLHGNPRPETDPIWSIGWDHRSLLLLTLDRGVWHTHRLPKASHCYDGAHGWNTEWPRIRDIGERDLLMTMHGTLWRFPRGFRPDHATGLRPRSSHLKVIGDFCRWNDRIVFGCDDAARSEFLNQRPAKGRLAPPGRSQSNLWFVEPDHLDHLGPPLGRGAVWLHDTVPADQPSDPFLFAGYAHRSLHLAHSQHQPARLQIEVNRQGRWRTLQSVDVPSGTGAWIDFPARERGDWIRIRATQPLTNVTALFHYRGRDSRSIHAPPQFEGLARPTDASRTVGWLHAGGGNAPSLRFLARGTTGEIGAYELDAQLQLRPSRDPNLASWMRTNVAVPEGVLTVDAASVLFVDRRGRWRLPKGDSRLPTTGRVCREVCTERDLFNAHGTLYELPAENAGGFAKIRPITTHNRCLDDFASYRGLLVLSGITDPPPSDNPRLVRSEDGGCALWLGALDDLWALGKPRGTGGPWLHTPVRAGQPSDPYLMTGYDRKTLTLAHDQATAVDLTAEVDPTGEGDWIAYRTFPVPPGRALTYQFPDSFGAYWIRLVAHQACQASAVLTYE